MTSRDFDPFRLDVAAFAKEAGQLEGHWPLAQFDRVIDAAVVAALEPGLRDVAWGVRGERRVLRGGDVQVWLHLRATTGLPLQCQRCLGPVAVELQVERSFLFVHGEDAAAELDAQSEDDVLPLTRSLDLRELIEDELLLAMPVVPRHEVCPVALKLSAGEDEIEEDKANPFAALASMKRPDPLN